MQLIFVPSQMHIAYEHNERFIILLILLFFIPNWYAKPAKVAGTAPITLPQNEDKLPYSF